MASTSTTPSKSKPSPSDEIVELRPPAEYGFSGTVKYYRTEHATAIALLKTRGYVVVDQKDSAA